ncbi:MAG: hypothetical protein KAS19_09415 [Anaerolineales bacterium]|nr:hypothetical protein [Anaerolineales bacterium]
MNASNKTTKTFSLTDMTEDQAQDILTVACKLADGDGYETTRGQKETFNSVRQALLTAGLTKRADENAN